MQAIVETIPTIAPTQSANPPTPTTTASVNDWYADRNNCPDCAGAGHTSWKSPYNYPLDEVVFCECEYGLRVERYWLNREFSEKQAQIDAAFERSGIPARFRGLTIDGLIEESNGDTSKLNAVTAAQELIRQGFIIEDTGRRKRSLLIHGDYGVGKTGLLTPVLNHYLGEGKSALWIEVYDFTDEIQDTYGAGSEFSTIEKMNAAKHADAILLDDLGDLERIGPETEDKRKIIYQLINYRHNEGLPTLITSNLTLAGIADQFGKRTLERIAEMCAIRKMAGKNMRFE